MSDNTFNIDKTSVPIILEDFFVKLIYNTNQFPQHFRTRFLFFNQLLSKKYKTKKLLVVLYNFRMKTLPTIFGEIVTIFVSQYTQHF